MDDVKYEYGCEVTSTKECPLREEIRSDAIDECIRIFKETLCFSDKDYIKMLEQLKEQNK